MEIEDEAFQLMCTLKSQIIVDGNLTSDYDEILRDLFSLVSENKTILRCLDKSDFITETLLHTLKYNRSYDLGLQFIFEMLNMGAKVPVYFYSKNFVFFTTEKLYEHMDDCGTNLEFVTTLIRGDRRFISSFEECGYFVLASSLIVEQSYKLFRQIFDGYEEEKQLEKNNLVINNIHIDEDVMFEIHRKNFDSEIVFRESGLIKFDVRKSGFLKGNNLLDKIFNLLFDTNLYNFLDHFLEDTVPILSYKKVKCDWLLDNNLFVESAFKGDLHSLRVLRFIIEDCENNGLIKLESIGYLPKISKLLEDRSYTVKYETVLGICNFISRQNCVNFTSFTEKRIRAIFSLLEKCCVNCACKLKFCTQQQSCVSESLLSDNEPNENCNIEQNIVTKGDLSSINVSFSDFSDLKSKDFSSNTLFPSDLTQPRINQQVNLKCLEDCETMRILNLLFNIYDKHKKVYFYKMSYVILLKSIYDHLIFHNCFDKEVFNSFFSDIITFLISNDKNISRILFMFQVKRHKKDTVNEITNDTTIERRNEDLASDE